MLFFFTAGLLPCTLECLCHWERNASRWRPAFSSHLKNAPAYGQMEAVRESAKSAETGSHVQETQTHSQVNTEVARPRTFQVTSIGTAQSLVWPSTESS